MFRSPTVKGGCLRSRCLAFPQGKLSRNRCLNIKVSHFWWFQRETNKGNEPTIFDGPRKHDTPKRRFAGDISPPFRWVGLHLRPLDPGHPRESCIMGSFIRLLFGYLKKKRHLMSLESHQNTSSICPKLPFLGPDIESPLCGGFSKCPWYQHKLQPKAILCGKSSTLRFQFELFGDVPIYPLQPGLQIETQTTNWGMPDTVG